MAWGTNAGYAINPARDFGPRLASLLTGYDGAMMDQHGHLYLWLPIVAPVVGGLIGGLLFRFLIDVHLPDEEEAEEPDAATAGPEDSEAPPVSEPWADYAGNGSRR